MDTDKLLTEMARYKDIVYKHYQKRNILVIRCYIGGYAIAEHTCSLATTMPCTSEDYLRYIYIAKTNGYVKHTIKNEDGKVIHTYFQREKNYLAHTIKSHSHPAGLTGKGYCAKCKCPIKITANTKEYDVNGIGKYFCRVCEPQEHNKQYYDLCTRATAQGKILLPDNLDIKDFHKYVHGYWHALHLTRGYNAYFLVRGY